MLSLTTVLLGFATLAGHAAGRAGAAGEATFARDVAPILYARCVGCHRAGEVAPMSLVTYDEVRPWAKSIQRKVTSREMPPWGADPRFGRFKDDPSLKIGRASCRERVES